MINNRRPHSPQPTSYKITSRSRSGRPIREEINKQCIQGIQRGNETETDNELEDERRDEWSTLFENPAIGYERCYPESHSWEDGLEPRSLDREVS